MSTATITIPAGGTVQGLTGSYHIVRLSATGVDGGAVSLYDGVGGKTYTPGTSVSFNTNTLTNRRVEDQADCAGINRDYIYSGVSSVSPVIVSGALTKKPMHTIINGTAAMDVDLISMQGVWIEAEPAGEAGSLVIEYLPNLSASTV